MTGARYRDLAARMAVGPDLPDGPLAVPTPQPSETCDPQPITEAPFTEWLCSGQVFDCCLYRQPPGPGPFALPTEQPSPYSEGTTLGRLLTDAERERLRDAEETVLHLTSELAETREATRALVAHRDARIRELEAEVLRLREAVGR